MTKQYRIETPDGKTLTVEGPDDATDAELIDFARGHIAKTPYAKSPVAVQHPKPESDIKSVVMQGLTAGSMDEILGGVSALGNMAASPFLSNVDFDPVGAYQRGRDLERGKVAATREAYPWLSTGGEILGGLLTGGLAAKGAGSLASVVKAGAKTGAIGGGVAGFNYGEGLDNSLVGAGLGSVLGGGVGAAIPVLGRALMRPVQGAINYMRPQNGLGGELVHRAMLKDSFSPRDAGAALDAARARGVPLSLSDLGENLRGLTGSVSRKPGTARTMVRNAIVERQQGQGERIQNAITRDLGPVGYVPQISDDLKRVAQTRAAPLYEEAYQKPVIATPELDAILKTPAGRQALAKARTIAANERRDPEALGFRLNANNEVELSPTLHLSADDAGNLVVTQNPAQHRGYTMQTLDYIKRGLDDVVEANRDPVTRRLNLDTLGRSENDVRSSLLTEVDRINPAYAQARAAYQGPARAAQALEQGRKAVNASADDIQRMTAGMNDADKAQFALGHRSALSEMLERRVDAGDKAGALFGSPRKRDALSAIYGPDGNLPRFGQTLDNERAAYETYKTVALGSPTANRLADDAATEDGALLQDLTGSVLKGTANGGLAGGFAEMLGKVQAVSKFGAGKTGERAREDAASLLIQADPSRVLDALRDARKISAENRKARWRLDRQSVRTIGMFGRGIGGVSAFGSRPADD